MELYRKTFSLLTRRKKRRSGLVLSMAAVRAMSRASGCQSRQDGKRRARCAHFDFDAVEQSYKSEKRMFIA